MPLHILIERHLSVLHIPLNLSPKAVLYLRLPFRDFRHLLGDNLDLKMEEQAVKDVYVILPAIVEFFDFVFILPESWP